MYADEVRSPRADGARNAAKIVRTARATFTDLGPNAPLEEVARRAGVRVRTVYNHFPSKAHLVRASIEQAITEDLAPVIERSLADEDALRGFVEMIEAGVSLAARERNLVAAARNGGGLVAAAYTPFLDSLTLITSRAQQQGSLRADLVRADLPRIMAMMTNTLWTMGRDSDGWKRYFALLLVGLTSPDGKALPPPVPLVTPTDSAATHF